MLHPCDKPCGNKTASGYCATTACINPQYSNLGTAHYSQGVQKRIITNADRIRAMGDAELAEFLSNVDGDFPPTGSKKPVAVNQCEEVWLDWLSQGATDG